MDGQEIRNKNPDYKNLLEDGEEKYAYYKGGKIPILHGPKVININNEEKYLYLVGGESIGDSDIWEAFMVGDKLRIQQYAGPNQKKYYAEMLAEYAVIVSKKNRQ